MGLEYLVVLRFIIMLANISKTRVRYNGDSESVQYLATDDETDQSSRSNCCIFCSRTYRCIERTVLCLTLIMSTMALIISVMSYSCIDVNLPPNFDIQSYTQLQSEDNMNLPVLPNKTRNQEMLDLRHENLKESANNSEASGEHGGNDSSIASTVTPKHNGLKDNGSRLEFSSLNFTAHFMIINQSLSMLELKQSNKLTELARSLRNYTENELDGIRVHVEGLIASITEQEYNFNSSLQKFATQRDQDKEFKRTLNEDIIDIQVFRKNIEQKMSYISQQIALLNTTAEECNNRILEITSAVSDLRHEMAEHNSTQDDSMHRITNHIDELHTKLTTELNDVNMKNANVMSKIKSLQGTYGDTRRRGNDDHQRLTSFEIKFRYFELNNNRSFAILGRTTQNLSDVLGDTSRKVENNLRSTNASIRKLQQRLASLNSKINGYEIDIQECKATSESLSAWLTDIANTVAGKADVGWIQAPNGFSYHISSSTFRRWSDAQKYCDKLNATLAYLGPGNGNMTTFLHNNIVEPRGIHAWIGLTDFNKEGIWKWIDGRPLSYSNWAYGQPNNVKNQDCAEIGKTSGEWNDQWCNIPSRRVSPNAALCEK